MKKNKRGEELLNMSSYVNKELHDAFDKFAEEDMTSVSDVMRKALREYADRRIALSREGV